MKMILVTKEVFMKRNHYQKKILFSEKNPWKLKFCFLFQKNNVFFSFYGTIKQRNGSLNGRIGVIYVHTYSFVRICVSVYVLRELQ